jgi:iron complex outermembrane receptor protein
MVRRERRAFNAESKEEAVRLVKDLRNDIARIGAPTASGSILRRNVGSSYRRGLELDWAYRGIERVVLAANANWSTNRIAQFTDSSRGAPVVRRNVEPLLTPRFTSAHRVEVTPVSRVWVSVEGRYQSRAFLDNTSSPDRVLPDYYTLDATARLSLGRTSLTLRGQNLGDTRKFGSGAVSSSGRVRYFILPARALFVTAAYDF